MDCVRCEDAWKQGRGDRDGPGGYPRDEGEAQQNSVDCSHTVDGVISGPLDYSLTKQGAPEKWEELLEDPNPDRKRLPYGHEHLLPFMTHD